VLRRGDQVITAWYLLFKHLLESGYEVDLVPECLDDSQPDSGAAMAKICPIDEVCPIGAYLYITTLKWTEGGVYHKNCVVRGTRGGGLNPMASVPASVSASVSICWL
jgi:hypothetical protein